MHFTAFWGRSGFGKRNDWADNLCPLQLSKCLNTVFCSTLALEARKVANASLFFHIAQTCCKTHRFFQSNVAHMFLQHERILYTMGLEAHIEDMDKLLNTKLPQSRVSFLYTYIYKHIIRWLVTFRHFSILFTLLYLSVILVHAIWSFWPGQDPRHPGLPEFHPPHPRMTIDLLLQQGFRCNRHKMVLKESAFDETPFHPPRRTIFF